MPPKTIRLPQMYRGVWIEYSVDYFNYLVDPDPESVVDNGKDYVVVNERVASSRLVERVLGSILVEQLCESGELKGCYFYVKPGAWLERITGFIFTGESYDYSTRVIREFRRSI